MKKSEIFQEIVLTKLSNETHVEMLESVCSLTAATDVAVIDSETLPAMLAVSLGHEKEALDYMRKSDLTHAIDELDSFREHICRGFADVLKGLTNHYDPAVRADAHLLTDVVGHYGSLAHRTLDAKTAAIDDFVRELSTEAHLPALKRLKMDPWAKVIFDENKKFHGLMMDRYDETASKTTYRMKTARKESDKFFHALVAELDNFVLKGRATPAFHKFAAALNAIITRYNNILAQGEGRKKGPNQEPDPQPPNEAGETPSDV
jgi:hypothetical protein